MRAREIVHRRFFADCQAARAALEGDAIIPALVTLIDDVTSRSIDDGVGLTETLQQIHFRSPLAQLAEFYSDLRLIDTLPRRIARLIVWQGTTLGVFVAAALLVLTPYCVTPISLPGAATLAGYALIVVGILGTSVLGAREAVRRNHLVGVFQKYDDFQLPS